MEIIIDAAGCERGLEVAVCAGVKFAKDAGVDIAFSGAAEDLSRELEKYSLDFSRHRIIPASEKIEMHDSPLTVRSRPFSSIVKAFQEVVAGRSQALVSAGHTGATVVCARDALGMLEGVSKPALCQILPSQAGKRFLLLDVGANISSTPNDFVNFALMGALAAQSLLKIENPRVGLLNIGREAGKGNPRLIKTSQRLQHAGVRFIGNIEGDHMWFDVADVVVTDGITGNIVLKSAEGLVKMLSASVLESSRADLPNAPSISVKSKSSYGGAPLLGVNGAVIVSHGNADCAELVNALQTARWVFEKNLAGEIARKLSNIS